MLWEATKVLLVLGQGFTYHFTSTVLLPVTQSTLLLYYPPLSSAIKERGGWKGQWCVTDHCLFHPLGIDPPFPFRLSHGLLPTLYTAPS